MLSTMSSHTTAASLPSEESAAAAQDEPPDNRPRSLPKAIASLPPHTMAGSPSRVQSGPPRLEVSLSPTIPISPYMADSTGGSASDYEHELDSPSSLSSWNSWAGGRRGDLADVEDLELDGMLNAEPELETVSELDEESSGFCSGSDRPGLDSDEEGRHHHKTDALGLGFDTHRRSVRVGGHFNDVSHNHHVHHASNQHHYHHNHPVHSSLAPSFPHFSPRAGGHGLSHASRYSLRAPPNLAARRRKGRIAELAEEGGGDAINTTIMPKKRSSRSGRASGAVANEEDVVRSTTGAAPSQNETETEFDAADDVVSPSTPTLHSTGHAWNEFEFVGPPPLPVRSVSPSETVPVIPSPLCVCLINAEEQGATDDKSVTETTPGIGRADDTTVRADDSMVLEETRPPTPPSPTTSGRSGDSLPTTVSTPPTTPPISPQLTRKSSRGRRSSSPGRAKPKVPLRPCFIRRASAQTGALRHPESSSECESNGEGSLRGRGKVRFSEAPPVEVRTHSPVDYDRKACPISNRLSPSDVEELREMKMEMGLLEAKWAAMAACKPEFGAEDEEESEGEHASSRLQVPNLPPPLALSSSSSGPSATIDRKRADSISSSSPTRFCKNRLFSRDSSVSPADHLRMEREKERERACRMAGIGIGAGFRYTGGAGCSPRQLHHGGTKTPGACDPASLISRFGLSKPPPPLPGMSSCPPKSGYEGGQSLHRPSSAPPTRSAPHETSFDDISRLNIGSHDDDSPRGRMLAKSESRNQNASTSTDGTVTGSPVMPSLMHTSPSPPPARTEQASSHSLSLPVPQDKSSTRPSILPHQPARYSPPTSSHSMPYSSSPCGYDSPASEFYESGSEYDLIG